jgi:hypothetical protein
MGGVGGRIEVQSQSGKKNARLYLKKITKAKKKFFKGWGMAQVVS